MTIANTKQFFQSLLSVIFLFGFTVGTGSVKARADYGMSLLWTIALSCIITYLLLHFFGKYTLITGEMALASIKKKALLPWLLDDYHERKSDLTRLDYRIFALVISLLGLIVPLFNAKKESFCRA